MARTSLVSTAAISLALTLLYGCGGGGSDHKSGSSGSGKVLAITGVPLAGATVKFYNATSNTAIASGVVSSNGSLPVTVPAEATRFSIDASGLEDGNGNDLYWPTYRYGTGTYFDDTTTCYAPLPNVGSTQGFADNIVFYLRASSPPPPPPTGCVGV